MSRTRQVLKWSAITFAGVITLVALFFAFVFNWNMLRTVVGGQASSASGRSFAILGDLHVDLSWAPRIRAEKIVIGNAPWGRKSSMVEIDRLEFTIKLSELLRGQLVLPEIELDHPKVLLEKKPDGTTANWDFTQNPAGSVVAGAAVPKTRTSVPIFDNLLIKGGTLTYIDPARDMDIVMEISTALGKAGQREQMIEIKGTGAYQKAPFRLLVRAGSILKLREGDEPYPIDADIRIGKTHGRIAGTVAEPMDVQGVDVKLTLEGDNPADLFPITGIPIPTMSPYKLTGHLLRQGETWTFENFVGGVGHSDLSGTIVYRMSEQRSFVQADLKSDRVDLKDIGGFIGIPPDSGQENAGPTKGVPTAAQKDASPPKQRKRQEATPAQPQTLAPIPATPSQTKAAEPEPAPTKSNQAKTDQTSSEQPKSDQVQSKTPEKLRAETSEADRVIPDAPLDFERLRALDADVKYRAKQINAPDLPLDDLTAHLTLKDGVLTFRPLNFGVGAGKIQSNITLDGQRDIAATSIEMQVLHVKLKSLLRNTQFAEQAEGEFAGRVKLYGKGNSLRKTLAASNGNVAVLVASGRFSSLLLSLAGLDIAKSLGVLITEDKSVPIRCFVSDFAVETGVMTPRAIVFDTETTNIAGDGKVDLGNETLDLKFLAHPKKPSISARAPILVTGSFAHPDVAPDSAVLAARGGAAAVLGVILTPVGALIPFVELAHGKDSDCQGLLTMAAQHSGTPEQSAPPPSQ